MVETYYSGCCTEFGSLWMRHWVGEVDLQSPSTELTEFSVSNQPDQSVRIRGLLECAGEKQRAGEACQAVAGISKWMWHMQAVAAVGPSGPFKAETLPRSESEHIVSPVVRNWRESWGWTRARNVEGDDLSISQRAGSNTENGARPSDPQWTPLSVRIEPDRVAEKWLMTP